jgi:hypothetical protein
MLSAGSHGELRGRRAVTILLSRRVGLDDRRMSRSRIRQLLVAATAISLLSLSAIAGSAHAAYPPGKPLPPRVRCAISTIVDRRIAVSCNAGTARAGKPCSITLRRTIVARGKVGKDGRYFTRFTVPTLLTRGTTILFLVEGKIVATLRV